MMNNPLAEDYFDWLAPQIRNEEYNSADRTFDELCRIMHVKEFIWFVPNDDNRLGDGRELRHDFCRTHRIDMESLANLGFCSFLEVLIGLSKRLEFIAGGDAPGWAWELLNNLHLGRMYDRMTPKKRRQTQEILDRCIWRTYPANGEGGFFPLAWPIRDYRDVELWYQMSAYIQEQHPEY